MTETEPLPQDSPLWELDSVLLSPHCADRTATFQVGSLTADSICTDAFVHVESTPVMHALHNVVLCT